MDHCKAVENQKAKVEKFFAEYEQRFRKGLSWSVDVEATASAFAACFIEASPSGVICGQNNDEFRKAIPQGMDFYRGIGMKSMKITSLEVITIDKFHVMAKVHWDSHYTKKDGHEETIDFDVCYLLQTLNGKVEIFAYITGNEQKILRERGLVQDKKSYDRSDSKEH